MSVACSGAEFELQCFFLLYWGGGGVAVVHGQWGEDVPPRDEWKPKCTGFRSGGGGEWGGEYKQPLLSVPHILNIN